MEQIKVLLVDDQVLFVESLKKVIQADAWDITVAGIAHNGREAVDFVKHNTVDVILMDVRMPVMDGVEATAAILKKNPDTKIMMLTTFDDDKYVQEALYYGAIGYLLKDIPPEELLRSIRSIKDGNVLFSPKVASKLVKHMDGHLSGEKHYPICKNC